MTVPRYIAPAGSPILASDLVRWAANFPAADAGERLGQSIRRRFGVRNCSFMCTGRAALTVLLRALQKLATKDRDEVIVPSYTCYSVASSVVKAGLRPRLVDIAPDTLDYAPESLAATPFDRVLAVIATNLYGLPSDLPALSKMASERGAFLVDDAAQSMGALVGGKWSGTWGDAGLFSLDKGKPVAAIDGGIVVTNSDVIAESLRAESLRLPPTSLGHALASAAKVMIYAAFLRPSMYWIPQALPQLGLGLTEYTTVFPEAQPDTALLGLGLTTLEHLDDYVQIRQRNAAALINELRGMAGVSIVVPLAGSMPGYLRLPVLLADARMKQAAIRALNDIGIGASGSYPASLADVPELSNLLVPGPPIVAGREVAARIMTLPTHPFVSKADRERIVTTLAPIARSRVA